MTPNNKTSQLSDEDLVVIVRDEDQEIYAELITRYETKLIRYAQYLIKNNEVAKDAVQSAFIKAFKNLQSFNTKKKFSSWIYRIVHNEALNMIKKESRSIPLQEKFIDWFSEIKKTPIEDEFSQEELKTYLQEKLSRLPIEYYEPLVLSYLEDKSYEEISDILQIPIGTVGTRINRGKKKLKSIVYNITR